MNDLQKKLIRSILDYNYNYGFMGGMPLEVLAGHFNLKPSEIFDKNTETGILYPYSQWEEGLLELSDYSASVNFDMHSLVENWIY